MFDIVQKMSRTVFLSSLDIKILLWAIQGFVYHEFCFILRHTVFMFPKHKIYPLKRKQHSGTFSSIKKTFFYPCMYLWHDKNFLGESFEQSILFCSKKGLEVSDKTHLNFSVAFYVLPINFETFFSWLQIKVFSRVERKIVVGWAKKTSVLSLSNDFQIGKNTCFLDLMISLFFSLQIFIAININNIDKH